MKNSKTNLQTIIPYHSKSLKRIGTRNSKTGRAKISPCHFYRRFCYEKNYFILLYFFIKQKKVVIGLVFQIFLNAFTEGDTMEQAYKMAVDALGLAISSRYEQKETIPTPSEPENISVNNGF